MKLLLSLVPPFLLHRFFTQIMFSPLVVSYAADIRPLQHTNKTLSQTYITHTRGYFSSPLWVSHAAALFIFYLFIFLQNFSLQPNKGSFSGKHPLHWAAALMLCLCASLQAHKHILVTVPGGVRLKGPLEG